MEIGGIPWKRKLRAKCAQTEEWENRIATMFLSKGNEHKSNVRNGSFQLLRVRWKSEFLLLELTLCDLVIPNYKHMQL